MSNAALAKTGVEAVIDGLGDFTDGFGIMNKLVSGFGKNVQDSERKFRPFQGILNAVTESLRRIGEFVIAGIILRGIDMITSAIKNMIGAVIDAGIEFQGLQIRLENFIAADIFEAGGAENFAAALEMAAPQAEELFVWVQKLALTTPFDTKSIADAMTMARAWGFNADEAKNLTRQVIDFTAGMGFGADEMDRVIKALGQMKSLGRVAGQELLQLANAGVPVADIMEDIRLELGLTEKEFDKLRRKGGVSAEMFFEKWEELVETRFEGSAQRMSHTLGGVISNFRDLTVEVVGLNVVKPVLDVIGDKLGNIFDTLTGGARGDILINSLKIIGQDLAEIVGFFFGKLPSEDNIADFIIDKLLKLMQKIGDIREIITGDMTKEGKVRGILQVLGFSPKAIQTAETIYLKIKGFIDGIRDAIISFVTNEVVPEEEGQTPLNRFFNNILLAIQNFKTFWDENKEGILGALSSILESVTGSAEITGDNIVEIISGGILGLSETLVEKGPEITEKIQAIADFINDDFLPAWDKVTTWIADNKETIFKFFAGVALGWQILTTVMKFLIPIAAILVAALALFASPLAMLLALIPILIGLIFAFGESVATAFKQLWEIIKFKANEIKEKFTEKMKQVASDAMDGFIGKFIQKIVDGWNQAKDTLNWFVDAVRGLFDSHSPSRVFMKIGESLSEGLAKGIVDSIQLPAAAMEATVSHVISAGSSAMSGSNTNNTTVNNNFNMNIKSSAKTEPIIADFNTMKQMAGVY